MECLEGLEIHWLLSPSQVLSQNTPFYHSLDIYTEVTFVNVHQGCMSTFAIEVCPWYIGFVLVFITSFH